MVSVTLNISDELKTKMSKLSWVNWSETAREDSIKEAELNEKLERLKEIVSKSKFTEKDALELGRKINKSLHERYKKMYPEL